MDSIDFCRFCRLAILSTSILFGANFFILSGSLIEYAVILYRKQKVSKYGAPSQSIYGEKATAAAALAAATHSAASGAISLASGLAKIGANFGQAQNNQQPKSRVVQNQNPTSPDQNDEMYDMSTSMVANMYDDASSKYSFLF